MYLGEIGWERRADGTPVRVIRDDETGRTWRVRVADTQDQPGARGDRCLVFDGGDCMRRVWEVPDDWARMTPAALLHLAEASARGAHGERVRPWRPFTFDARPTGW